jgi:hypothetical protein
MCRRTGFDGMRRGLAKLVARIEISVAQKVERAAMESVAAGFGDHADLAAGEFSVNAL